MPDTPVLEWLGGSALLACRLSVKHVAPDDADREGVPFEGRANHAWAPCVLDLSRLDVRSWHESIIYGGVHVDAAEADYILDMDVEAFGALWREVLRKRPSIRVNA